MVVRSFRMTDELHVVFETIDKNKDKWMRKHSFLVDCVYAALSSGGIVRKGAGDVSVLMYLVIVLWMGCQWKYTSIPN